MTKQYIWLIRYGKTEFPLCEHDGPYDSDIHPVEGVAHAQAIAQKIATSETSTIPSQIFCSPFLRTTHTASIIAKALSKPVNVEQGLYEYLIPSLLVERKTGERTYPRNVDELCKIFDNISSDYESKVEITPDDFPETELELIERCRKTLNGILTAKSGNDHHNIAIVAHAPCVQSLAFVMEGVDNVKDSKLKRWPLGGVTRFSREVDNQKGDCCSDWSMDFYGATDHMPGEYKEGAGLWSLPCFEK